MTHTDDTKPAREHTPEPWEVIPTRGDKLPHLIGGDHCRIALLDDCHASKAVREANARRLRAIVNACEGISTKALEQGIVAELRHVLGELLTAAADLDAAIDGVTDQFDEERTALDTAYRAAEASLAKASPERRSV